MALRRREIVSDRVGGVPEWFIPSHQVKIGSYIASGAYAYVSVARWHGGKVAVTSLRRKDAKIFRRQVNIWSALNHPSIVHLYGANHVGNPFYMYVCEMATNGCLTDYLKKKKNQAQVWHCLLDVALGLQYLHSCGVIHGNLRGDVCLVFDSAKTKVGSFGLSVFADSIEIYDEVFGAIRWKAPEILDGGKPTFAADIYSFGMCVIEALTGTYPWGATLQDAVVKYQVSRGELPTQPAEMEEREWEFVKRMCRFDPGSRISIDAVVCYISGLIAAEQAPAVDALLV